MNMKWSSIGKPLKPEFEKCICLFGLWRYLLRIGGANHPVSPTYTDTTMFGSCFPYRANVRLVPGFTEWISGSMDIMDLTHNGSLLGQKVRSCGIYEHHVQFSFVVTHITGVNVSRIWFRIELRLGKKPGGVNGEIYYMSTWSIQPTILSACLII